MNFITIINKKMEYILYFFEGSLKEIGDIQHEIDVKNSDWIKCTWLKTFLEKDDTDTVICKRYHLDFEVTLGFTFQIFGLLYVVTSIIFDIHENIFFVEVENTFLD